MYFLFVLHYLLIETSKDNERINDAYKVNYQEYEFKPSSMTKTISKLLHDLGMPSHIKGYQYIRRG